MIEHATKDIVNIEIKVFKGLLMDFAEKEMQ